MAIIKSLVDNHLVNKIILDRLKNDNHIFTLKEEGKSYVNAHK